MSDLTIGDFQIDIFRLIAQIRNQVGHGCVVLFTPKHNSGHIEVRTTVKSQKLKYSHRIPTHGRDRLTGKRRRRIIGDEVATQMNKKIRKVYHFAS